MPTVITHALLPLIAGKALGAERIAPRLVAAGMIAAILPDADIIGSRLGIPYGAELGHRGASHSLMIAILLGTIAAAGSVQLQARRPTAFLFVAASAASHGLTDMLTDGGRGVALLWPMTDERLFLPFRPVEVSSIGLRALTDGSMVAVLASEFVWLVAPATLLAILIRRSVATHIDLVRGQS